MPASNARLQCEHKLHSGTGDCAAEISAAYASWHETRSTHRLLELFALLRAANDPRQDGVIAQLTQRGVVDIDFAATH